MANHVTSLHRQFQRTSCANNGQLGGGANVPSSALQRSAIENRTFRLLAADSGVAYVLFKRSDVLLYRVR
jgi:hypothetical protein